MGQKGDFARINAIEMTMIWLKSQIVTTYVESKYITKIQAYCTY